MCLLMKSINKKIQSRLLEDCQFDIEVCDWGFVIWSLELVWLNRLKQLPGCGIVEPHDSLFTTRCDKFPISSDIDGVKKIAAASDCQAAGAAVDVPKADRLVSAAGCNL